MHARLALLVALLAACDGDGPPADGGPRRQGDATVGGRVVSTVDGVAVTLDEVRDVARATGLAPRQALERLQEQALLAAEAERRGYARRREVALAARKAAVQALLEREVERVVTPAGIPVERVRRRWREREAYHRPERRTVRHVLARAAREADPETDATARSVARDIVSELRSAPDPGQATERYRDGRARGIPLVVERIEMHPGSAIEEPFKDAALALDAPGVVPEPVRTRYGWHAIVVTDIQPAREVPFEQVEDALRRELVVELRRDRVEMLLDELAERFEVAVDEPAVERALSRDPLADREGPR